MFNEYQKQAAGTFKPASSITDPNMIHALDWSLGLGGETGEVLDLIKHAIFHKEPIDRMELAKELGDVLWYVNALCTTLDMALEDIAELNLAKLAQRYNKGYNAADSANRHAKELVFKDSSIYKILEARINKTGNAPVNIIVIGPDGAGKTTLIKRLSEILSLPVTKCDYRTEDKLAEANHLLNSQINVLYDRFYYPDDIVYSELKKQGHADYTEVVKKLKQLNTLVIFVTAPLEDLISRSTAWADDYVLTSELRSIINNYDKILPDITAAGIPLMCVNNIHPIDSASYNTMLNRIEDFVLHYRTVWGNNFMNLEGEYETM